MPHTPLSFLHAPLAGVHAMSEEHRVYRDDRFDIGVQLLLRLRLFRLRLFELSPRSDHVDHPRHRPHLLHEPVLYELVQLVRTNLRPVCALLLGGVLPEEEYE